MIIVLIVFITSFYKGFNFNYTGSIKKEKRKNGISFFLRIEILVADIIQHRNTVSSYVE